MNRVNINLLLVAALATAGLGVAFLVSPLISGASWSVPVLVGATLVLGALIIRHVAKQREKQVARGGPVITTPSAPQPYTVPAVGPDQLTPAVIQQPSAPSAPSAPEETVVLEETVIAAPPLTVPNVQPVVTAPQPRPAPVAVPTAPPPAMTTTPPMAVPTATPPMTTTRPPAVTTPPMPAPPTGRQPQTTTMTFNSEEEFLQWARENQPELLPFLMQPQQPEPPGRRRPRQEEPKPEITVPKPPPVQPTPEPAPSQSVVPGETGSSLTSAEAQAMVDAHNKRRARFGTPPLAWDPEIAKVAQAWTEEQARRGRMQHSQGGPYGENLAWSSGMNQTPEDVLVGWADEEEPFYDYESNSCKGGVCGHFTAVVWKDTKKLGCGRVKKGRELYWTCNYSPAGNFNMFKGGNRPY